MDKKKKIIIVIVIILAVILLSVGGYFIYKNLNRGDDTKEDGNSDTGTDTGTNVDNSSGSSGVSNIPANPFSNSADLKKFQQYVINVKGDKAVLGTGGDSGYGDDGKWGRKSSTAWDKYKDEFYKWARTSGSSSNCPTGQVRNSVTGVCEAKTVTASGFKSGDTLYQRSGKLFLYEYPSQKSSIGYIADTAQAIGTFVANSTEGFIKIKLDKIGYTETGIIYDSYRPVSSPAKEVYVYSNLVKK